MKLNVCQTVKILLLCVLFTETIICSTTSSQTATQTKVQTKTQTEAEGRFLMKAGFLKHQKKNTAAVPGSVRRNTNQNKARSEVVNLVQKSESKKAEQNPMAAMEAQAKQLANVSNNPNDPAPLDLNIGTGPVWVTGWVKYFKYFPSQKLMNLQPSQVPKTGFQINPDYNEQFKVNPKWQSKIKETSKDDMGNDAAVYITDKNKFFAKLMKDQIVILSSRDVNKNI